MEDLKVEIIENDSSEVYRIMDEWRRRVFYDQPYVVEEDRVMF